MTSSKGKNMVYTAYVLISGRVQGVFFRLNIKKQAEEHDVKGWVRNRDDGKVEAVFEGEKDKVDKLIAWCHIGPPRSKVKEVKETTMNTTVGCRSFSVIN